MSIAYSHYSAMLTRDPDRGIDVRPSGFWWVIAELSDVIDPLEEIDPGATLRAPGIESLVTELLVRPKPTTSELTT
jgi:hypothetical protein